MIKNYLNWISCSCLFILMGCQPNAKQTEITIPHIKVAELQPEAGYQTQREYVGMISPAQNAQLGFEFSGKIDKIHVTRGQFLEQGEHVATLDTSFLDNERQQLFAKQKQFIAQIALVETNLKRQRQLQRKGFSSEAEIDALISQRDHLNASVQELKVSLASNKLRLEKSSIYAPFRGQVHEKFLSVGDVVNPGQAVISFLSDQNKEARFGIPLDEYPSLAKAETSQIRVGENFFTGKLLTQTPVVDPKTRTVNLTFSIDEATPLINGSLAYLEHKKYVAQSGFWVPMTALTDGIRGTWNLFIVTPQNEQERVQRRAVDLHYSRDEKAYISGNFQPNERVIVDGVHRIVADQIVQVTE